MSFSLNDWNAIRFITDPCESALRIARETAPEEIARLVTIKTKKS